MDMMSLKIYIPCIRDIQYYKLLFIYQGRKRKKGYLCNGMPEGKASDLNIIPDYTKVNHYSYENSHFGFHGFQSFV